MFQEQFVEKLIEVKIIKQDTLDGLQKLIFSWLGSIENDASEKEIEAFAAAIILFFHDIQKEKEDGQN